jgi:hypothetical protein
MDSYTKKITNPVLFYIFTLRKLPSLWFWGVRVAHFDSLKCCIRISYSWFTKNPFQSVYFSALSGAAELSTGLLVQKRALEKGNVSMLVIRSEAVFIKKAKGDILFCCDEGALVDSAFLTLQNAGSSAELELQSQGFNQQGELVARFRFTWALKRK